MGKREKERGGMLTEANMPQTKNLESHFFPSDGNAGLCPPHTQGISQIQYVNDNILRHQSQCRKMNHFSGACSC